MKSTSSRFNAKNSTTIDETTIISSTTNGNDRSSFMKGAFNVMERVKIY